MHKLSPKFFPGLKTAVLFSVMFVYLYTRDSIADGVPGFIELLYHSLLGFAVALIGIYIYKNDFTKLKFGTVLASNLIVQVITVCIGSAIMQADSIGFFAKTYTGMSVGGFCFVFGQKLFNHPQYRDRLKAKKSYLLHIPIVFLLMTPLQYLTIVYTHVKIINQRIEDGFWTQDNELIFMTAKKIIESDKVGKEAQVYKNNFSKGLRRIPLSVHVCNDASFTGVDIRRTGGWFYSTGILVITQWRKEKHQPKDKMMKITKQLGKNIFVYERAPWMQYYQDQSFQY